MNPISHQVIRVVCSSLNDIEEWRLGDAARAAAKGYPRAYKGELIDDWGMLFMDFTVDAATGALACHEVNGPNGAGSDALTGESSARAENEARQAARRAKDLGYLRADGRLKVPAVTIHAHQHWKFFRTGSEFYPRFAQFAENLQGLLPGNELCVRGATETLGAEQITVIGGDVPAVGANLSLNHETRGFEYRGRPVIFIGNTNLIPEMIRVGKLRREGYRIPDADMRVFHGWRLAEMINDKALQQRLMRGTGIRPLRHFEANSIEETVRETRTMLGLGPVVLKPNYGSGGTGVQAVAPDMTNQAIRGVVESILAECRIKYGDNVEATVFPIRGFEFVRSTGFSMPDGGHLWDLRIAVLFEPGKIRVFPGSLRFAPEIFDPKTFHVGRDQWISNVSGREVTLHRSGLDDEMLSNIGMTPDKLELAMKASAIWTAKAWDMSIRDGGPGGAVYEDECEEDDPSFYPTEKFSV